MMCSICGCMTTRPAVYMAKDDRGSKMVVLPAVECQECGAIRPDVAKIASMPDVPSSVRLRCAKILAHQGGGA
jgi:hypothetical protein